MSKSNNYDRTYSTMRAITLVSVLSLVVGGVTMFWIHTEAEAEKKRSVYVVTDRGTMSAYLTSEQEVSTHECDLHSKAFIYAMFGHDKDTYEEHVNDALNLIDEPSGKAIVEQFEQGKILANYIKWGSRTEIAIDSINRLSNGVPPHYKAYFKQRHFIGEDLKTELAIAIEYDIIKSYRHTANPHGLLLSNVNFIAYHQKEE